MANKLIIRDQITINDSFTAFLAGVAPGETLKLVARSIQHAPGYNLELSGRVLSIVTSTYSGNGGAILTAGGAGDNGGAGSSGSAGSASLSGAGNRPGGVGQAGTNGRGGKSAGSIRILGQSIDGLHIVALGGTGGAGGPGGSGGPGGNGRRVGRPTDPEIIEGTGGGAGGPGGNGGTGGPGGHIAIASVAYSSAPYVEIAGGPGGPGGNGGNGGAKGALSSEPNGPHGPGGAAGASGPLGSSTTTTLSENDYWLSVVAELAGDVSAWAAYRHSVGEFLFRGYTPNVPERSSNLQLAVNEFQAALRLSPDYSESSRLRDNVWNNNNALGLRHDLDVIPHFDEYIQAFTSFGNLVLGFVAIGSTELLHAVDLDAFTGILTLQKQETQNRISDAQDQLMIAKAEQKDASDAITETNKKITDTTQQIQAAQAEMNNHSMSFGSVIGVVGEVAGAVVSVIAAIPTGGASLVALVPDIIALTKTIADNAAPLAQAIFKDGNDAALKQVKDGYGKVNKDAKEIINDTKAVINMVNVIEKIAAGSTPDNSKYVALVQKGAELAHELLLQQRQLEEAGMKVDAINATIGRANDLLTATEAVLSNVQLDDKLIREAGLRTIRNAQLKVDTLLGFAFRAQRSVEIYTLKDESQNLFLDAGHIHPDAESDYRDGRINDAQLISAYSDSWTRLLQPINMQADYLSYFDDQPLNSDIRRLSFQEAETLQAFRDTHTLSFAIEPTSLPPERFDTKAQAVFVSFVGATSPSGIVSCQIQHGNRYTQQRSDGTRSDLLLEARTVTLPARTTQLELGGVDLGSNPPLSAPQALPFWGRGLCGRWEITIPQSEFDLHHPELTGLTEIQVWLGYQFQQ